MPARLRALDLAALLKVLRGGVMSSEGCASTFSGCSAQQIGASQGAGSLNRSSLAEVRRREAGGCGGQAGDPLDRQLAHSQDRQPYPSPQGRTRPSSLLLPGDSFVTFRRASLLSPPMARAGGCPHWPAPFAFLPGWGSGVLLHTVSRAGLPPRGVVAGPWTVLLHLPGAHAHDR